jgi:hypothetical protein
VCALALLFHATVPWYADPDTKPFRPGAPRPFPEDVQRDKIGRSRDMQALYRWVRANWKDGDWPTKTSLFSPVQEKADHQPGDGQPCQGQHAARN